MKRQPNITLRVGKFRRTVRFQKHKLSGVLGLFDGSLTEAENMFMNGYRRLWDAGHIKYLWKVV